MQKTVLSFGETLWDLFPSGPVLGGAPFNLASRVNFLGDRGIIVTRLGRDDHGRKALAQIVGSGMDRSHVQKDDHHPTGTVNVTLDSKGNPEFSVIPEVAYDFIEVTYELMELAGGADCFCFGTLAQRASTSRLTLRRLLDVAAKSVKFLDVNLRKDCFSRETIAESLKRADILKMNLQEAHYLARLLEISLSSLPDFCAKMMEQWSLRGCVVTLGEHGALAASADGTRVYEPGYEIRVADTCGAGDAFSAGFIHEYLRGEPLAACCRLGNALGAMVAMQTGATTPISLDEVRHFLSAKRSRLTEPDLKTFAVE